MKTLKQHNSDARKFYRRMGEDSPCKNGIACPKCGKELFDTRPTMMLASDPPQKAVHCECGYSGYRVA